MFQAAHRVALALALLGGATRAQAGTFDFFGVGGRGMAMGNAMTAAANDWSASYYNPALLTRKDKFSFGAGFQLEAPMLTIAPTNLDGETRLPITYYGFSAGALFPVGGKLKNRVVIGLLAYFPGQNLVRTNFQDSAIPHFYMYDSQPSKFSILPNVAVRITDWMSAGGGMQLLAALRGTALIVVDVANGRFPKKELSVDLVLTAAPNAGLAFRPTKALTVAASYRGQLGLNITLPTRLQIDGLDAGLLLDIRGSTLWTPHVVNLGVAYTFESAHLTLSTDASLALWSRAPDPSVSISLDIGGEDAEKLGLADALDAPSPGNERHVVLGFSDTLSIRAGIEWEPRWWLALRSGYMFRPTPAPVQTSGTNILDNDAHTVSLGFGFQFKDPLEVFGAPIGIDLSGQLVFLPARQHLKDTANDPVGDLAAGGTIFGLSAMVRYTFGP